MAITLTPEREAMVRQDAEFRGFANVEEYLADWIVETPERELYLHEHHDEISAMIDEGCEEAERGEFLTPEQVKENLAVMKAAWLAARKT
jgi:predicted transcriptional regulator